MVSRASRSSRSICHDGLPSDGRGARRAAFAASCFRGALPFRPDRGLGPAELPPRRPPRSPPKKPATPVPGSSSSDVPELSLELPELSPELSNPPLAPMSAALVASCLRGAAPPRPARGLGPAAAAAAVAARRAAFVASCFRGCLPPVLTRGLGPAAALGALLLIPAGCSGDNEGQLCCVCKPRGRTKPKGEEKEKRKGRREERGGEKRYCWLGVHGDALAG